MLIGWFAKPYIGPVNQRRLSSNPIFLNASYISISTALPSSTRILSTKKLFITVEMAIESLPLSSKMSASKAEKLICQSPCRCFLDVVPMVLTLLRWALLLFLEVAQSFVEPTIVWMNGLFVVRLVPVWLMSHPNSRMWLARDNHKPMPPKPWPTSYLHPLHKSIFTPFTYIQYLHHSHLSDIYHSHLSDIYTITSIRYLPFTSIRYLHHHIYPIFIPFTST